MTDQASKPPVVLRGGTVLVMDDAGQVLQGADVLVVDDRIAAVGPALEVPAGTVEIDASGGIVMPGMIDTHRHMWQTAMRGYGADWTLTQYFVWYYLESGKHFRPEDVHAGNLLAAVEAIDAGVTTCVDTGLASGIYTYRVTAVFRTWSAQSAASANVADGSHEWPLPSQRWTR
jgi:cytosine/adenosine deaminase-related metal-dependent hydrolase